MDVIARSIAEGQASARSFPLAGFWRPEPLADYKVHFARWNGREQPIDVFARSFEAWAGWNGYYPGRNDFNRPFVFSLMQVPNAAALWLFGGIFAVRGVVEDGTSGRRYDVALTDTMRALIGRLRLFYDYRNRGTRVNLENHFDRLVVHEITAGAYAGPSFPGYAAVHLGFAELEALIANGRADWSAALSHVKGVYLVTDDRTGRRYVGSACGGEGVWSRWTTYSRCGHGGNVEMRRLLDGHDTQYCRESFRFALLEHFDARTPDDEVLAREAHWKAVLRTRDAVAGLNRN